MFTANNSLLRIWNPSGIREIFHSTGCDHCCTINWKILILVWQCQLFFDKFSRTDISIFRIRFFIAASKQLRLETVVPLSQSDFPSTLSHHCQSVRIRIGLPHFYGKTQPRNSKVTLLLSRGTSRSHIYSEKSRLTISVIYGTLKELWNQRGKMV